MYYYLSELYIKVKLVLIACVIIELYLYFYTEDLVLYFQNQLFFNRSLFFIEYSNDSLNHNTYTIGNDLYLDIFIDYQLVNTTWNSDISIIFMYMSLMLFILSYAYEIFIYSKSILYNHELFKFYCILIMLWYLLLLDVICIQYLYIVNLTMDNSVIYKTVEWSLLTYYFANIYTSMILCFALNIVAVFARTNTVLNLTMISVIYYYLIDVSFSTILIVKWIIMLEFKFYYKIYNYYLDLELKKNNNGICKGM